MTGAHSAKKLHRLRSLLSNLQVNLILARYTKVNAKWRQMHFVPDFNRFYYIREGEGCLVIDGEAYYPRPGQLFVMPAGVKQSYYTINENAFGKYWCHFTAKIGDTDLFRLTGAPYFINVEDEEKMTRLFQQLIREYESSSLTAVVMQKATLLEIIGLFLEGMDRNREAFRPAAEDRSMQKMTQVLKYIETHLHENVTVHQLAELVHYHPNYLIRQFRELVGMSPIQYAQRLRMETAISLLAATDEPISAIAEKVGMELYYFSRTFKKHTGLSPTDYRRLMRH
jgi:AraC-like DNA-binding protein